MEDPVGENHVGRKNACQIVAEKPAHHQIESDGMIRENTGIFEKTLPWTIQKHNDKLQYMKTPTNPVEAERHSLCLRS